MMVRSTLTVALVAGLFCGVAQGQEAPGQWQPVPKEAKEQAKRDQATPGSSDSVRSPGLRGALAGERAEPSEQQSKPAEQKAPAGDPMVLSAEELASKYEAPLDRTKPLSAKERLNLAVAESFYRGLESHDFEAMKAALHEDIAFSDPAYPDLKGDDARAMWQFISETRPLKIKWEVYKVEGSTVYGGWVADYEVLGRPVHNVIKSKLTIEDGKIRYHRDSFDLDAWSKQALPWVANKAIGLFGRKLKHKAINTFTGIILKRFKKDNGY